MSIDKIEFQRLKASVDKSNEIAIESLGGRGTIILSPGTAYSGKDFVFLAINQDAVFSVILAEDGTDVKTDQGFTGVTITAGLSIRSIDNKLISDITLVSGTAMGIKKY